VIALALWGCVTAEPPPSEVEADPHGGLVVDAGEWIVGGGELVYEAQPRHHAVQGERVLFSRADGGVEVWTAGAQVQDIGADCPHAQCPVPQVGFVDGGVAILRPRVGALPVLTLEGGGAASLPDPQPWTGQPYQWVIPRKWGVNRRPLAVASDGIWVIPGESDDVVAASPDRRAVAWSDWQGRVHVGPPGGPPTMSWAAPPGAATRLLELAWSDNADRLVAIGSGQAVQVFDPQRPRRLAGGAVAGVPRGLVVRDAEHAIGWTSMGIACLRLDTLTVVGLWSPGHIRHAHIGPGGETTAIAGEHSGVARLDVARLCHLQE
jgi:hypothetical protein